MTKIGYIRVSTSQQKIDSQKMDLKNEVDKLYIDKDTGKNKNRPFLQKMLNDLNAGDTVIVTKIDRLARSTKDLLDIVQKIDDKKCKLIIKNMGGTAIDTETAIGKLLIAILGSIAEFELSMIKDRQKKGIQAAKKNGKYKGRPKKYTDNNYKTRYAKTLMKERNENKMTVKEISMITGISRATLYRLIKNKTL